MLDTISFIKASLCLGSATAIGFGAIGAALGVGYAAALANESLSYQPERSGEIIKYMLVGQAIAESAGIFALVVALVLFFITPSSESVLVAWSSIGAGLCMGFSAIGSGVGAGLPGSRSCRHRRSFHTARWPH